MHMTPPTSPGSDARTSPRSLLTRTTSELPQLSADPLPPPSTADASLSTPSDSSPFAPFG